MFAPERVSVPAPLLLSVAPLTMAETVRPSATLVTANVGDTSLPLIVALVPPPVEVVPVVVSVPAPVITLPPAPAPATLLTVSAPIVSEKSFKS